MKAPRLLPNGDAAISVDFGNEIDVRLNARVHALDKALQARALPYVVESVPTYRALMVHFDPVLVDHEELRSILFELATQTVSEKKARQRWRVPVAYGGAFGADLEAISAFAGLDSEAFISAHLEKVYTVLMLGFLPGFCYLGGLDPRLAMPRREQPRLKIPPSSISIGGAQTAIGSVEGPSGWHLIGRTPVIPFMTSWKPVFMFEAGDEILFSRISDAEWLKLSAAAQHGEPIAEPLIAGSS